ncbi:uncharacterized protein P884DRAFT_300013 [Thermothelomyces heterothallicus CBS 202.75]|uniref:uncharacterized protein n=1 Tax=Thermothelomyces heterothallicus CBS 202.75 TaxID=1149848 RepID=UPI00374499B8
MRQPAILAVGCSLGAALPDVPTPESFLRRIGVQTTVLGDYVYRQVSSVGGADKSLGDKDEAAQGLLLFDMTTWKWGDSYDAEAADYEQAKEIKEWYTNGSLANVERSSDEVRKPFVEQKTRINRHHRVNNSGFGDSSDDSEKTPVGAIIRGVIGGVAVVAIVVAGLWIFIRRRRKQQEPAAGQNGGEDDNDSNNPPVNRPGASSTAATASPTANHAELPGATFFPSGGGDDAFGLQLIY